MRQCFPPLSATAPDTRERAETASGQKKNTALAAGLFVLAGLLVNDGSPASQRLAEVSSRLMLNHFAVELVLLVLRQGCCRCSCSASRCAPVWSGHPSTSQLLEKPVDT